LNTKKKKLSAILGAAGAVILLGSGCIAVNASRNKTIMSETINEGLKVLSSSYALTQLDAGEFSNMRMYGFMKFHVDQYSAEKLGNISVMTADMGFMQMASVVITPYEKNMPMCSLDFMYIMGKRKSYAEFYDLTGNKETAEYKGVITTLSDMTKRYKDIEELETEKRWYDAYSTVTMHKQLSHKNDQLNKDMFIDVLKTYTECSSSIEKSSDEDAKKQFEATQAYCDGLIEKGGVSTDTFKKTLGDEKTREFFNKVFFGMDNYRI
jgi:hypothetical protein